MVQHEKPFCVWVLFSGFRFEHIIIKYNWLVFPGAHIAHKFVWVDFPLKKIQSSSILSIDNESKPFF